MVMVMLLVVVVLLPLVMAMVIFGFRKKTQWARMTGISCYR